MLFPIDWPEPFALVVAESLACGTPVVARRRGAVPEVLRDGETGLLGATDDDLVQACRAVGRLARAACRADAERRFWVQAMVDGYETIYRQLLLGLATDMATLMTPTPSAGFALTRAIRF